MTTNTMVAINTQVVTGSPTSTITFTSIPQTYTDLVLVINCTASSSTTNYLYLQFNNDGGSGSLYSTTVLTGTGSSAISNRWSGRTNFNIDYYATPSNTEISTRIVQLLNYSNTTTYKTGLVRASRAGGGADATVGLWRNTNAISRIDVTIASDTFAVGSTFTLYGIANADIGAYATGGIITQDSTYYYHAFGSSGTFTPSRALTADILVVAGGGGAGYYGGGGGGAGGVQYLASQSLSNGTGYSCVVGAGGASATASPWSGTQGANSTFNTSTVIAIGGGAGKGNFGALVAGGNGGSGGAAGGYPGTGTASGGTATAGTGGTFYGNNGGGAIYSYSGGGGGAGAVGGTAVGTTVGAGGNGTSAFSSWLMAGGWGVLNPADGLRYIAGGGAGNGGSNNGGLGGGGAYATNGLPNTGSGSGGDVATGGAGSGLIIVRYLK